MAMNPNPTCAGVLRSHAGVRISRLFAGHNLMARARLRVDKLLSLPYAHVLTIFVIGFATVVVWHSYGSATRKAIASSSPRLSRRYPPRLPGASERYRLVCQQRGKTSTGPPVRRNRLEVQGADAPRRGSARRIAISTLGAVCRRADLAAQPLLSRRAQATR